MRTGMVDKIAAMQDFALYRDLSWEGSFEDYLGVVKQNPQVTRNAFQRVYDMIIRYGIEEYTDNKKKLVRYNFFKDEQAGGADAVFGLDIPLMRLVHVFKAAAEGYGAGEARHPPPRAGGLLQVDHRPPAQEGPRALLHDAGRRALHLLLDQPRRRWHGRRRERPVPLPDARGAAAPHPTLLALQRGQGARPLEPAVPGPRRRRPRPGVPLHLQPPHGQVRRRLVQGDAARPRQAPRPLGEGSRRHRHLPAQGREEPGLDRAHRRHQLPQDRRVRLRLRPARLQLRRRVQHRQPRRRRVHRGAQARRGLPLRSARRFAGAQDQAEEVRPDGHRRGDRRPHERGRVQEAPLQRVHGGAPRPHHQDRHPLHHQGDRGDPDLREGLRQGEDRRQAHRPPHAGGGGDVGGAHAARGSEEAQPLARAEDEALRRQGPARLHAGHRQGAAQGGRARGDGGHQPALRAGQDLERARQRHGRGDASTPSWS